MVEVFLGWTKKRGLERGLAYFEKLAKAAAEAEASDPDQLSVVSCQLRLRMILWTTD